MSDRNNRRRILAPAGLAAGVIAASNVVCAQIPCEYQVTIIAPEPCDVGSAPAVGLGISEDGNVVGYVGGCLGGPDRAFFWTPETGFNLLPTPPGTISSRAYDIAGTQIVGAFDLSGDGLGGLGFVYDSQTNDFINLGTLPGGNYSTARAINTNMQVTGYWGNFVNGDPSREAFIWEKGRMTSLAPDLGTPASEGRDINSGGQVTGWMGTSEISDACAFIWDAGKVTVLPPIPGGFTSEGEAINSLQQVAGEGSIVLPASGDVVKRSFLWSDGEMRELGTLPGTTFTRARGISDQGVIVGYCHNPGLTNQTAFVWQDGVMTALNDLIPPELGLNIKNANAINQTGQITGRASGADGTVAFRLTPVEPPLGDLDGDCTVGVSDLLLLLTSWGPCNTCNDCPADLNGDCVVGVADVLILLANWG